MWCREFHERRLITGIQIRVKRSRIVQSSQSVCRFTFLLLLFVVVTGTVYIVMAHESPTFPARYIHRRPMRKHRDHHAFQTYSHCVAICRSAWAVGNACLGRERSQVTLLLVGGALMLLAGLYAPASFMSHFIVFVLSVFIGFQVIWNVSHSLHTPLMAVTNAISSIIILGALMQIGSGQWLVVVLAALSVFMAGINIFGGFMVTRRMLAMFQKS